jgi:hypothetical protein
MDGTCSTHVEVRYAYSILVGKFEDRFGDLGIDERVLLKLVLKK